MAGYDQRSNVVISECKERVYSIEEGVEEIPLGLYLVKGDMMYVLILLFFVPSLWRVSILIGEIDDAIDQSVDLSTIRAEPIPPIRY
jgi:U6 snRNA-associated Sm-like protein LSm8